MVGEMQVILAGIDEEHLKSASDDGLGAADRPVSYGTTVWPEPEQFPRDIPIYIYAVTRGESEPIQAATWVGTFRGYRRREQFASQQELDDTRPRTTIARRDPMLPDEQQEPEWPGYLLVTDLRRLDKHVPLRRFRVGRNRPFTAAVVRRPMLVDLPT
jgi:hypothetical protein